MQQRKYNEINQSSIRVTKHQAKLLLSLKNKAGKGKKWKGRTILQVFHLTLRLWLWRALYSLVRSKVKKCIFIRMGSMKLVPYIIKQLSKIIGSYSVWSLEIEMRKENTWKYIREIKQNVRVEFTVGTLEESSNAQQGWTLWSASCIQN